MKTAVLIVGHGSRLPAGNEEVRQFAKRIEAQLPEQLLVETCFLEF
ncbi:MAG: sirohydrochlorin chelatase, partial [Kurthia sp.]|nr:sirohydrochlorin chelatase [Kurthia sp.]